MKLAGCSHSSGVERQPALESKLTAVVSTCLVSEKVFGAIDSEVEAGIAGNIVPAKFIHCGVSRGSEVGGGALELRSEFHRSSPTGIVSTSDASDGIHFRPLPTGLKMKGRLHEVAGAIERPRESYRAGVGHA